MSLDNYRPGAGTVSEYQVSPVPWVTGSTIAGNATVRYDFPYLASSFAIQNLSSGSAEMAIAFTPTGASGSKRIRVRAGTQFAGDFRFKSIYLVATTGATVDFDLIVGLTGVHPRDVRDYKDVTGSAYFSGMG